MSVHVGDNPYAASPIKYSFSAKYRILKWYSSVPLYAAELYRRVNSKNTRAGSFSYDGDNFELGACCRSRRSGEWKGEWKGRGVGGGLDAKVNDTDSSY
jgi:hypothetical protein